MSTGLNREHIQAQQLQDLLNNAMKQILSYILTAIVDNPDKIVIEESEENGMINFTITVAKEDMGKVIGKEGRIIRAMRNVMKIPAIKQGKKINISLSEIPQETIE